MRKFHKLASTVCMALSALLMLSAVSLAVLAIAPPSLDRRGSITIRVEGEVGEVALFRVARTTVKNGVAAYEKTAAFADCAVSMTDIQSADAADLCAIHAKGLPATATAATDNGTIVFADLEPGVYLCVMTRAAQGYLVAKPFLITVPLELGNSWLYDVSASPKMEQDTVTTQPTDTTPGPVETTAPPVETTAPPVETTAPPVETTAPDLPQTGQNDRPVPFLAVAGMMLFAAGWVLCYGAKKHEK